MEDSSTFEFEGITGFRPLISHSGKILIPTLTHQQAIVDVQILITCYPEHLKELTSPSPCCVCRMSFEAWRTVGKYHVPVELAETLWKGHQVIKDTDPCPNLSRFDVPLYHQQAFLSDGIHHFTVFCDSPTSRGLAFAEVLID